VKIIYSTPEHKIARVYVAETSDGSRIEFADSIQPPLCRDDKLVLIVSTLKGCPIDCLFCDAGGTYKGKLTKDEMFEQIEYMIRNIYSDNVPRTKKLKVQFARMGEPAFNPAVLDVLEELPSIYGHKILFPSVSTIAPLGCDHFFNRLIEIKDEYYSNGKFQLQFSIHTTDDKKRKELIPARTMDLDAINEYGNRFYRPGDRKITLNFATPKGYPVDPDILLDHFAQDRYLIKFTPVNPTRKVLGKGLKSMIDPHDADHNHAVVSKFKALGYETIVSIGELEENQIGSNCGMYINRTSI